MISKPTRFYRTRSTEEILFKRLDDVVEHLTDTLSSVVPLKRLMTYLGGIT